MNAELYPQFPILIVDDEENFLNSMKMTLKSNGITNIECCQDSQEVISRLKKKRYSLIFLDILMPHTQGDALLPQILEEQPGVKVIMLTAVKEIRIAVKCMHNGAVYYLAKPFEISALIEKVGEALDEVSS